MTHRLPLHVLIALTLMPDGELQQLWLCSQLFQGTQCLSSTSKSSSPHWPCLPPSLRVFAGPSSFRCWSLWNWTAFLQTFLSLARQQCHTSPHTSSCTPPLLRSRSQKALPELAMLKDNGITRATSSAATFLKVQTLKGNCILSGDAPIVCHQLAGLLTNHCHLDHFN